MMKLVISEKADAAARIAVILSRGDKKSSRVNGVQVFQFEQVATAGQWSVCEAMSSSWITPTI